LPCFHLWFICSSHPHSMRKVANIVIGVLEGSRDDDLSPVLHTETVVMRLSCDSPVTYSKQDKELQCTVCDNLQKRLVHSEGDPYLLAVTLKGGNQSQSVRMNLSTYASPSCNSTKGQPVCLGIAKSNLYLSCTESDSGSPHLSLEVKELKMIRGEDGLKRFLFLRSVKGGSVNTFESARFPGWFISTATEDYQPVEMCAEADTSRQRVFTLLTINIK
uniref:Interleukin-1 n=1 Tax=Astyanax mexicanus TaxID=7994 RepID=A0A3B1KIN6_ASTMX